jgi:hypothetical protein
VNRPADDDLLAWTELAGAAMEYDRFTDAELCAIQVWLRDPAAGIRLVREQLDDILRRHGLRQRRAVDALARRCSLLFFWVRSRVDPLAPSIGPAGPAGPSRCAASDRDRATDGWPPPCEG